MRYNDIKINDSINGEGVCVSLFVQGCARHCKGCFNKDTWDFNKGKPFGGRELQYIKHSLFANGLKRNLSILGGEPLNPQNIKDVKTIIKDIKIFDNTIKIFVWTGYTYEELIDMYSEKCLEGIDVLIDGKFEIEKKDVTLSLRGSSNQRIIDVPSTLKNGKIVLYKE